MNRLHALIVAASALLALVGAALYAQQPQRQLTPEQQAQQESTRQDHQRMLEALKITSLRPGANPNNPQAPNAVNYDESKANPYSKLPDPLVLKNGKKVTSARIWRQQRRPEIFEGAQGDLGSGHDEGNKIRHPCHHETAHRPR
jgi:hypothetical protein